MTTPVLTISSRVPGEPYYFYHEFVRSCEQQGFKPEFLPTDTWRGLCSKPKILLDWIENNGVQHEHIIFCDAWDILFVQGVGEIMERYRALSSPIVFNSERACFPRGDLAHLFPDCPTPYRFLNSGFIVGRTEAIHQMLLDMKTREIPDDHQKPDGTWVNVNDQELFTLWFLDHKTNALLDYNATICQSLHLAAEDEFWFDEPNRAIRSTLTKVRPCVFHGNGGGKEWLKKIMQWLKI